MTWFDDGDGWRDESTEGPYDYLATYMPALGELTIFRSYSEEKYRVRYNRETIGFYDSVKAAKKSAVKWYRENKSAAEKVNRRDAKHGRTKRLGRVSG